jgi:hypothetical protein
MRKPCDNCPWRKDAPTEYWHPDHFHDIWSRCQDDGMSMMLCHKSNALPEAERGSLPCQGWARVMGYESIGVRIAVLSGKLDDAEVRDRDTAELYGTFAEMLEANRIELPKRNKLTMTIERLTWTEAAERLDGYECDLTAIQYSACTIGGRRYSIAVHRRDDDIVYVRACEREPSTHCLVSRDRRDLLPEPQ